MINNFWFYFFLTPVAVGTIILSIPSFYYSSINPPVFEEAVSTCKNISNEDKLQQYAVKARAAVEKFKGNFIVRGGKTTTNEGEKSPRTVVIEFPSFDEANKFYKSKEYQEAHDI